MTNGSRGNWSTRRIASWGLNRMRNLVAINAIANRLNDRPHRILDYLTPREVFAKLLAEEQLNTVIA
jgi:hypothetical protein